MTLLNLIQLPRHIVSDTHKWIKQIPAALIYQVVKQHMIFISCFCCQFLIFLSPRVCSLNLRIFQRVPKVFEITSFWMARGFGTVRARVEPQVFVLLIFYLCYNQNFKSETVR